MTPHDLIETKLRAEMVKGQMHATLRDVGRLAGGYAATGALSAWELHQLGELAESLSLNPREGRAKWDEAILYGRGQPVQWDPAVHHYDREIQWEDSISASSDLRVIRQEWVEDEELPEPRDEEWSPCDDLSRYLSALFQAEEQVGYVTEAYYHQEAERWLPRKGCWDRTAGQLLEDIGRCGGDIGSIIGDTMPEVGAWIRFNPLDGAGVRDSNVTAFRFALVECDNVPIPRQFALIKELELPVAALVHSGGKSLHAIVRVEADSYDQYRERVDFLYEVCGKNGLTMDRQNRNPSRLSRMPGVLRNGRKQWLIGTGIGKASWAEWRDWIEGINDDLPDIEEVSLDEDEPELAPALIDGVLRQGHKLLIAGPSKAGKSFALIQLAIALAEGGEWFGWKVERGRCLYVNLELDARSAKHRFWAIYREMGRTPGPGMIDVWNLRGNACSLDKLTPKLIRRAQKRGYTAVIIDPIYKVLTGDENSAAEMATFCNWFDRICLQLGAATIYCHHHSKGAQGQKSSRDRSSGSGVFARDPDAIIDMIELIIDEPRRKQMSNRWECEAMTAVLDAVAPGWAAEVSQDDALVSHRLIDYAKGLPGEHQQRVWEAVREARRQAESASGWRIDTTLREFPSAKPRHVFFRYPIHLSDHHGLLTDAKADGEESPQEVFRKKREQLNEQRKNEAQEATIAAVEACRTEDGVRLRDVAEYLNDGRDLDDTGTWNSVRTALKKRIARTKRYKVEGDFVVRA